ncbi:MAG: PEP-utilizing enzyme [Actinomycetota bacterium]
MTTAPHLGDGNLAALGIGPKAALLDDAHLAGLPVPAGLVVPPGSEPDRAAIAALGPRLAVRSAFSAEDGASESLAGRFRTELGVAASDVDAAVRQVRASAGAVGRPVRADVLVMHLVDARHAGVAFTEPGWEDDVVNVTEGLADRLVGGEDPGLRVALPRLRRFESANGDRESWQQRLAELLREVRRHFGDRSWDVEWADDGDTCWLVQLRPITRPLVRDEAFTIANHKEILPELPSPFMASVIEGSATELFGFYRRIDPSLPDHRPFIETFAGRPYLNLTLLEDLLRSLGLPTRLLADSLGGDVEHDVPLRPRRMLLRLPTLARFGLAQAGAVRSARTRMNDFARCRERRRTSVAEVLDDLRSTYVGLVEEMSSLASAMAPQVAILRAIGVLHEHVARQRTPATRMLDDLRRLGALADAPGVSDELSAGLAPTDPEAAAVWTDWLAEHGHRGIFESDLARPRHAEDPAPMLRSALTLRPATEPPPRSALAVASTPLWWSAARAMRAREELRSEAMRTFAALRADLLAITGRVGLGAEDLWILHADDLRVIDTGEAPTSGLIERRRTEHEAHRRYDLPDLLHRFDDLDAHREQPTGERPTSIQGIGLTDGVVRGRAVVASEPPQSYEDRGEPIVLVARSIDAGWIGAFGVVDAVAVDIGGDLSHGSIILRELGLPAVTNASGVVGAVEDGDLVELDGRRGTVRVVGS